MRLTVSTFIIAVLLGICSLAFATKPPAANSEAEAAADARSSSWSGSSGAASDSASGNVTGGDSNVYVLPAPISGTQMPAGMCARSDYSHWSLGWNFVSQAVGQSHTDMECLGLLVRLETVRREPLPKQRVEILIDPPHMREPVAGPVCTPLARKTRLGKGCPK